MDGGTQAGTPDAPMGRAVRLRGGWTACREGQTYTLARRWPARFDLSAQARFPMVGRARLAQQIRQDLWRSLKHLRGFSPVVQISVTGPDLEVTAGGQMDCSAPAGTEERISDLLHDPVRRARWLTWAGGRAG